MKNDDSLERLLADMAQAEKNKVLTGSDLNRQIDNLLELAEVEPLDCLAAMNIFCKTFGGAKCSM